MTTPAQRLAQFARFCSCEGTEHPYLGEDYDTEQAQAACASDIEAILSCLRHQDERLKYLETNMRGVIEDGRLTLSISFPAPELDGYEKPSLVYMVDEERFKQRPRV